MALYNLIGCRRRHDVIDAVSRKTACKYFLVSILALISDLIEMNVNINNKLNVSDV